MIQSTYSRQVLSRAPAFAIVCLALSSTALFAASDWPNWRGPNGTGSVEGGEYPAQWSDGDVTWKVQLPGKGSSTPIVWKERIYLTTPADGHDTVMALDLEGKELWRKSLGPESRGKHRTLGSGCNASPVTDGQRLYVYFKSGNFAALDFDGSVKWKWNLVEQFGRQQLFWDQGTSPVVTDTHVIMARMHGGDSWVAGFNKNTGELEWKQERNYKAPTENDNGYTTPVFFEQNGIKAFLLWGADHLTAHRQSDGQMIWSCGGFNPDGTGFWPAIASPVVVGDMAIVPVGRDDRGQASVYGVRLGGNGDVSESHRAWTRDDTGVFVCTPAVYKERVYLLRHRGDVECIDTQGKTVWTASLPRSRSSYYSSPTIANGVLYAAREDGKLFAARIGEKFELIAGNDMGERLVASPVAASNRLIVRGDDHLFCIAAN